MEPTCFECQKPLDANAITFASYKGGDSITVCEACAEHFATCTDCSNAYNTDSGQDINGNFVCDDCISDNYSTCRDCDGWINVNNDDPYTYDEGYVCQSCYDNNYLTCDGCGQIVNNGDAHTCETCERNYCQDCGCNCEDGDSSDYFDSRGYNDKKEQRENKEVGTILTSSRLVGCEIETEIEGTENINGIIPACVGLTSDGSLDHGVELITPPLRLATLENLIKETCKACDRADLQAKTSCGLHIHLDASDFKNSDIKIKHLLQTYFLTERVLYDMLPASRKRGSYCRPLANRFSLKDIQSRDDADLMWYIDQSAKESITVYNNVTGNYEKPNKKQLKDQLRKEYSDDIKDRKRNKMDSTRYHGLNIHGIFYRGAVELRYHSGTTNADKILGWIKINQAMVDFAVKNFKFKKLMAVYQAGDGDRINKFCDAFDLDNDIKKYIIERTNKFSGDAYANDDEVV
jgi:hypothetical protein